MSLYVLDTDFLSLLMKHRLPEAAREHLARLPAGRISTTAITLGELYYGALRSAASERWLAAIQAVVGHLDCLPFDAAGAHHYGKIRSLLEASGQRLDDADLRIASICLASDRTLVSGNERHFRRVPGLKLENWLTLK